MAPIVRALVAACAVLAGAAPQQPEPRQDTVVFETEKGTIEMAVDSVHAPATAANFLKYVDAGFYDGGSVNRAVRPDNTVRHDVAIQVIQFQIDSARRREQFPPIPLERTNITGLRHVDGAMSMARNGPDTATASFSIVIGDQPEMNFGGRRNPDGQGFAAFGRVVRGMDVVRAIQASPTGRGGPYGTESLEPPIRILKAYRRKEGAGLPTSGPTIAAADVVPASPQTIVSERAVLALPESCRVTGHIALVDPAAPPINFQMNLPASWNRKLVQLGGSGNNGVIRGGAHHRHALGP